VDAFCLIEEEGFIEIGAQFEEASQFGIDGHRDVQLGFGASVAAQSILAKTQEPVCRNRRSPGVELSD